MFRPILHTCVGAPTYFDYLPGDVLQYCIMPFLSWEDRIHLNMLTPPGDRLAPNKIPKDRIIAHQLTVSTQDLLTKILKVQDLQDKKYGRSFHRYRVSQKKITEAILSVLRTFSKDSNVLLLKHSNTLRATTLQKIEEFSRPANLAKITRNTQKQEMRELIQILTENLAEYPFVSMIKSQRWLKAPVTYYDERMQALAYYIE